LTLLETPPKRLGHQPARALLNVISGWGTEAAPSQPILYLLPRQILASAVSMAILLVYAAGLIIGILVLAIVAFFILFDDSDKDKQCKL
jgi:hypothetical protein